MAKTNTAFASEEGMPGFDWSMYSDGWDGRSLKKNKRVQTRKTDTGVTIYSHEKYAANAYRKYLNTPAPEAKEIKSGDVLNITDITPISNTTVMATVKGGANNIVIDLEKEGKFLSNLSLGNEIMTKETFTACLRNPNIKKAILDMGISAKVGTDAEKASIWDAFVSNLKDEMHDQIKNPTRAYMAHVIRYNEGGLIVEISNAVKAFLPTSLISNYYQQSRELSDYVDTNMEVMIEDFRPFRGFIVSRKKYLQAILPSKLAKLAEELQDDQEKLFTGKIIGFTKYGIFVQLDEYVIGMLHKSVVSDNIREAMRNEEIEIGSEINVYVHKIEDTRVVLSDVPVSDRDAVMARREAEEEAEKAAYAEELARLEKEAEEQKQQQEDAYLDSIADTLQMNIPSAVSIEE